MTTINEKGLYAVLPAAAGTPLRIRVHLMSGKNGKGVWLSITHDDTHDSEIPQADKNTWLLERPGIGPTKASKSLDLWSRKINVHARRIAAYFSQGDTDSIKRLVNSI